MIFPKKAKEWKSFSKKVKKNEKSCARTIPFFANMCYNIMANIIYSAEFYPKRRRIHNMQFINTEDLQKGMRLAKPIFNKNGIMLYDRDTKLTKQGINSIRNFNRYDNITRIYIFNDSVFYLPID